VEPNGGGSALSLTVGPSPSSGGVDVEFELPRAARVSLRVFDIGGREIATLDRGDHPAGRDRLRWDTRGIASGLYFCELIAGADRAVRRLLVVR
jgi:hypothetical protein